MNKLIACILLALVAPASAGQRPAPTLRNSPCTFEWLAANYTNIFRVKACNRYWVDHKKAVKHKHERKHK